MKSFFARFLGIGKAECVFLLLVSIYMVVSATVAYSHGLGAQYHPLMYLNKAGVMSAFLGIVYFLYCGLRALYLLFTVRPKKPARFLWQDLRQGPLKTERLARAIPVFIGFTFFFSAFTCMKQLIPGLNPFSWDQEFAALDYLLHFGVDPWKILHPFFGWPLITYALNINYNVWLVAVFTVLYWQLFSLANRKVRFQFFFAFILCWAINGNLLATIFSSAGPCFLERLTGSDYYAPLMAHLSHANENFKIFAVSTQNMIWDAASKNVSMVGGGISAMPSIHVSTAMIFWLMARALKNKYHKGFFVFFIFIVLGSIYLAWHYAVDGYLAIITTYALWKISGWMADKVVVTETQPQAQPIPEK